MEIGLNWSGLAAFDTFGIGTTLESFNGFGIVPVVNDRLQSLVMAWSAEGIFNIVLIINFEVLVGSKDFEPLLFNTDIRYIEEFTCCGGL